MTFLLEELRDPNLFGEIMRDAVFIQDREKWLYGCYSTFELKDGFEEITSGEQYEIALKKILKNNFSYGYDEEDEKELQEKLKVYYNKERGILAAWYWDGDGTLLVAINGKFAINDDCKKSYRWKFV